MGNVVAAVLVLLLVRVPGVAAEASIWLAYGVYLAGTILVSYIVGLAWVLVVRGPPRRFSFMTSVAIAVVLYAIGEGLLGGNGGIAAFVFGLVIGHHKVLAVREPAPGGAAGSRGLQEFHGELVFLLRTFFFLYLGLRVQLTGISVMAFVGAVAFMGVFLLSRWPSASLLTRLWRLPRLDSRVLRATVARGMTDTVLILFAIEVAVIPPSEAALVTDLLFMVIVLAALTSSVLVFAAERLARRELARAPRPVPQADSRATPLPGDLESALSDFLADPLVRQSEID